jgi:hypothetical protein
MYRRDNIIITGKKSKPIKSFGSRYAAKHIDKQVMYIKEWKAF